MLGRWGGVERKLLWCYSRLPWERLVYSLFLSWTMLRNQGRKVIYGHVGAAVVLFPFVVTNAEKLGGVECHSRPCWDLLMYSFSVSWPTLGDQTSSWSSLAPCRNPYSVREEVGGWTFRGLFTATIGAAGVLSSYVVNNAWGPKEGGSFIATVKLALKTCGYR